MKNWGAGILLIGALGGSPNLASAAIITSLYGDIDGGFVLDSSDPSFMDDHTNGPRSWSQFFTLDEGSLTSVTIELGLSALGFASTPTLFADGLLVGLLTDTDACDGSAAPGFSGCQLATNYVVDRLSFPDLSIFSDGVVNLRVVTSTGDGWAMDYSLIALETTMPGEPTSVPEPASLPLLAAGLLGLGMSLTRRRRN